MTKPYGVERTELGDMASLAVEQFHYLEALFSTLADQLDALDQEQNKLRAAKRLALLGRSHAEQWASAFLYEING
jgi:hypothetical protein